MSTPPTAYAPSGPAIFAAQTWGSGPPVMLLHGLLQDPESFSALAQEVADLGLRVVAPDWMRRGHHLWSGRGVVGLTDVLARFMERACGDQVAVLGHGVGGTLAFALAARYPRRVRRLVSVNGPAPEAWANHARPRARRLESLLWRGGELGRQRLSGHSDLGDYLLQRLVDRGVREHLREHGRGCIHPAEIARLVERSRSRAWRAALAEIHTDLRAGEASLRPLTRRITAPALMLWGDEDPWFRPTAAHSQPSHLPQLGVQHLRDAGHYLHAEFPEWVAGQCRDFLLPDLFMQPPIHA